MRWTKRFFVVTCAAVCLLTAAGLVFFVTSGSAPAGNVLLVTLDTTRADRISCYGYPLAKTPAIDALAGRGMLFERAYTPVPLTLPAHASLFTGLYPPEHGLLINGRGRLRDQVPVLAELLQKRGYETAAFVAAFVLDSKFGLDRGFQTYDDDLSGAAHDHDSSHRRRDGEDVMSHALTWLKNRSTRPFFCWVHLFDAHAAYDPRPGQFGDTFVERPYDAGIAYADRQLGRLMEFLHDQHWEGQTLVIVAGDHGEGLMEHDEDTHSLQIYESTVRVPLVIAGPAVAKGGSRSALPVSLVDLLPTILDCVGVAERPNGSGRTLKPVLSGHSLEARGLYVATEAPLALESWAPLHGIVTERWKYIRTVRPELYDLETDPDEATNLAAEHPELLDELIERLQHLEDTMTSRQAQLVKLSASEQRTLQSLGYAARQTPALPAEGMAGLPDVKDMIRLHNLIEQAKLELGRGDLTAAKKIADEVLEQAPHYSSASMLSGDVLMLQSKYTEAGEAYKAGLAHKPDDPFLHSRMGSALAAQDLDQPAVDEYLRALKIDPEFAQCHFDLGQVLLRMGQLPAAERAFEEAVRCDPALSEAHMHLGRLMARMGRTPAAIVHYQEVIKSHPDHAFARLNLASALSNLGRVEEALVHARKAAELDPQNFEARFHLASILLLHNRPKEAVDALRDALKIRPDDRRARELLEKLQ